MAKEESRRALEESRLAKEESERVKAGSRREDLCESEALWILSDFSIFNFLKTHLDSWLYSWLMGLVVRIFSGWMSTFQKYFHPSFPEKEGENGKKTWFFSCFDLRLRPFFYPPPKLDGKNPGKVIVVSQEQIRVWSQQHWEAAMTLGGEKGRCLLNF